MSRDDRRQVFDVILKQSLEAKHEAHPLHDRGARPALICVSRSLNRSVHFWLPRQWNLFDDLARRWVVDGQALDAVGWRAPVESDEVSNHVCGRLHDSLASIAVAATTR